MKFKHEHKFGFETTFHKIERHNFCTKRRRRGRKDKGNKEQRKRGGAINLCIVNWSNSDPEPTPTNAYMSVIQKHKRGPFN